MKKLLITSGAVIAVAAIAVSAAGAAAKPTKRANLTIVHVQNGCHVFSGAAGKNAAFKLNLVRGGSVTVLNQDIDGHKLVQIAGPAHFAAHGLKMSDRATLTFPKRGTYTFTTKTFELKGMPEAKTMGMDNTLRLTVVVS